MTGACLMVRSELLRQVGLLDEGYFLYFEEMDFCARARRAGWSIWHVPASRVVHLGGAATGINAGRKRRPRYWYDSRRRFFVRNYGIASLALADMLWSAGRLSLLLRRCLGLAAKPNGDPRWHAFDLLCGDAKAVLTGEAFRLRGGKRQ